MMQYIEIDKASVPYRFDMDFAGEIFNIEINYNERFDFFTFDIEKNNEVLGQGIKIVYGSPVFDSNNTKMPKVKIMPVDESGNETRAGFNQIGETVFLAIEAIE